MKLNKKVLISVCILITTVVLIFFQAGNIKKLYLDILKKPDENGMYTVGEHYFKSLYPLNEKSVLKMADKLNSLYDTFLSKDMNVYCAVIPDKTYFTSDSGYSTIDYVQMTEMLTKNVKNIKYINLEGTLSLNDYYKTDNHWRQEKIFDVANKLGESMGFSIDKSDFEEKTYDSFKGMYAKYATDSKYNENLVYLVNQYTENAIVENYQSKEYNKVYNEEKLSSDIQYDVYLSGASPIVTITNELADNEKELVIFRDSFASSLTPLIVSEYSKITLIDLRYVMSMMLSDFVEFDNQDVLFLYSSGVVNNSTMLK